MFTRLENASKEKSDTVAELQEKIASLETQKTFQAQKFKVNFVHASVHLLYIGYKTSASSEPSH